VNEQVERHRRVTAADVTRFARERMGPENRAALVYVPREGGGERLASASRRRRRRGGGGLVSGSANPGGIVPDARRSSLDAAARPLPVRPRAYHFPAFERRTLANGLRLVVAPVPKLPVVTVLALVDAGAVCDPRGRRGSRCSPRGCSARARRRSAPTRWRCASRRSAPRSTRAPGGTRRWGYDGPCSGEARAGARASWARGAPPPPSRRAWWSGLKAEANRRDPAGDARSRAGLADECSSGCSTRRSRASRAPDGRQRGGPSRRSPPSGCATFYTARYRPGAHHPICRDVTADPGRERTWAGVRRRGGEPRPGGWRRRQRRRRARRARCT
jgi:hypothetical protein